MLDPWCVKQSHKSKIRHQASDILCCAAFSTLNFAFSILNFWAYCIRCAACSIMQRRGAALRNLVRRFAPDSIPFFARGVHALAPPPESLAV